jgi:DNA-binding transcriptional LysR family regulator
LAQLEYVVAIAEEGSYTAAGTRLTIAQPSLSQQVAALEKELGCQLFERLHRGVRLTPAGRAFLPEARATVLAAQRARRAARAATQLEGGSLEIATIGSMAIGVLPDALSAWHRAHPDVAVNVATYRHQDAPPRPDRSTPRHAPSRSP